MGSYAEIQVSELGIKAKSKKEVYNLLCNVGDVYFPPIEDAHYKFISQILVSGKLYLKCFQIKVCSVSQLIGLRVEVLLKFQKKKLTLKDICQTMNIAYSQIANGCATCWTLWLERSLNYIWKMLWKKE